MKLKRILISLVTISAVGVLAVRAAGALFSDTETSTNNVLQAGAIDLKIDNTSYITDENGVLVASPETSWELVDLTVEKFFNFFDLKPGDQGEDTISIHVDNNDAWVCANAQITGNFENGVTDPENELGDTEPDGELANELNFAFWADDGDNVYEEGEEIFTQGPASNILNGGTLPLAQPVAAGPALFGNNPVTGAQTHYIGKYFCYGTLTPEQASQDTSDPVTRGTTGFSCDGTEVSNMSQTDQLVGDLRFYAVQSRNNPNFSCASVQWPLSSPLPTPLPTPTP